MKKILFILLFLITFSPILYGSEEDNSYLTGKIQSAEFMQNADSFVRAIIEGDEKKTEEFLKLGADPNKKYSRIPVIFFASHLKYDRIMYLLLEYGADPDTTFLKEDILKYSIFRKCVPCVSTLIHFDADINKKSLGCSSSLDFALQLKEKEIAIMLLDEGAIPSKRALKLMKKLNIEY